MNDKFDELAKGLAQSVTRRGALKKFGVGLAGAVLATLGLANKAQADPRPFRCLCKELDFGCGRYGVAADACKRSDRRHGIESRRRYIQADRRNPRDCICLCRGTGLSPCRHS